MSTDTRSNVRKEEEQTFARNIKFLEETQRISGIGSWEVCLISNLATWSDLTRKVYEVAPDYKPSFEDILNFVKDDRDKEIFTDLIQKALKGHGSFDTEIQITTALANDRWIRITGMAEDNEGHNERIYGVIQDITENKKTEKSLLNSKNQLQSVVQSVKGIFWEADATTFKFSFVSDHVKEMLGFTPCEWLSDPNFWEKHIHPADRAQTMNLCVYNVRNFKDHTLDYRMIKADCNIIWVKDVISVIKEEGKPTCLRGLIVDITETKRIEELGILEKSVLELNTANETGLNEVLATYLKGLEEIFPMMQCSFHTIKENRLEYGIAPSLPTAYLNELRNTPIGPLVGSCGTAAFLKQIVIVSDIAHDPTWADYREFALKYDLLACWSKPIIDSDGLVMATLAFYYKKVKSPEEDELLVIERCAAILKIILENRQKSILLKESSLLMKQAQELAGFGNWQWNLITDTVQWSDELYTIFGLDKSHFKATFEGYQELVHPDDVDKITETILEALQTKTDVTYEERIIRPDKQIRFLKTWSRILRDENGVAVKMTGACLDITESKKIQVQLSASESRLRSIADAQTNYVIRIDLTGRYTYYNNRYREDFGWIFENHEILGESSTTAVIPEHCERVMETGLKCIDNPNQVFQVELDKLAPNGGHRSTFWHFICLTDQNGAPFEIQCIGVDMSEKKKIENALKRSNERYQYVNKATNDATYDWNAKTNHVRWGEGFTRLFGFELNEEPKYPMEKWKTNIHESDREKLTESLRLALDDSTESRWQSAYQFRKKDGNYAYVQENSYITERSARKGSAHDRRFTRRDETKGRGTSSKITGICDYACERSCDHCCG